MHPARRHWVYARYKAKSGLTALRFVSDRGLPGVAGDLRRYPWLKTLAKAFTLYERLGKNREDNYLEATCLVIAFIIEGFGYMLADVFGQPEKTVLHEDMIAPEIFRAMGLAPFMTEILGLAMPLIVPDSAEPYIDVAENNGIPPDVCSLPKSTVGLALSGHLPTAIALVASNMPCDGGMSSYTVLEKKLRLPTMRLDIPHHFYSEKARQYFIGEMFRLIAWLEQHTPGRMDWDKLKEICEERNRMVACEMDLWDMIRVRPAPLAAEPVYLMHLWGSNAMPGDKRTTEIYKSLSRLGRENLEKGVAAVKNERFRALLWNAPLFHVADLFNWAESVYGVSLIMDSMTFCRRKSYINTGSEESMLYGLGQNIMEGPMTRHTRGPAANYIDDIFTAVKQFDIDMLWVAGHVGCKNTAALNGILREKCREQGLPLLIINYDLSDPRIVSREGILEQINHFMENIMKVKRDC